MPTHPIDRPARRSLRAFAFDPMGGRGQLSQVTIDVANERLDLGPSGSRVQVVDFDGTHDCFYEAVDLDDPAILMQAGLDPNEADPRFHQQMVYAVTLKVLENFDRALGRRIVFKGGPLRLLPHAFCDANAFFDPAINAVCFGYFAADPDRPGENLPGQTVFTCLSQDIIAHEVTHAVVHRLREYFLDASNDDVLAFHEGFADIVAIFQHFTFPDVLAGAIASTRGNLQSHSSFVNLAAQFGHATGKGDALRTALDTPDPLAYEQATEPHERGSILVAAVFDGFFAGYQRRIRDLIRIASDGRGILPAGDLHPDLVDRLAREAASAAQDVLTMCIRAFEYLPPVDVTFGDYLRALVTADYDLVGEDGVEQRREMIEAFRSRGIFPDGVISLSESALRWPAATLGRLMPAQPLVEGLVSGATRLRGRGAPKTRASDGDIYRELRGWANQNAGELCLDSGEPIKLDAFHATYRVKPDGQLAVEIVAQFTQKRDTTGDLRFGGTPFRSGATVVAQADGKVRFVIAKPSSKAREASQIASLDRRDWRDPAIPWGGDSYLRVRARRDFRGLHRGLHG
jgi:hypothetical protein